MSSETAKLTKELKAARRALRLVSKAADALHEAGALLSAHGFEQSARALSTASHDAAQAAFQAEADAERQTLKGAPDVQG